MNQSYCLNISRSKYFKVDRGTETQRNICHFLNNLDCTAHGPLARAKKFLIIWTLSGSYIYFNSTRVALWNPKEGYIILGYIYTAYCLYVCIHTLILYSIHMYVYYADILMYVCYADILKVC